MKTLLSTCICILLSFHCFTQNCGKRMCHWNENHWHLFLLERDNTQTQNVELATIQKPLYYVFFLMDDKSKKTFERQRIRVD